MDKFIIDITSQLENFKHFFDADNRLVFSAGFGEGKTYFFNEFKKKYSSEFYFITLYPINYVISDNESILEYIKRDICYQLAKDFCIRENKFDLVGVLKDLKDEINFQDLIRMISLIPQIASVGLLPLLNKLLPESKIKIFKLGSNNHFSSDNYIKSFERVGTIYENDAYTKFIRRILESFRNVDHKQTVLIIEDMDRIDPGHMFNILNIFGSHIDRHYIDSTDKTQNKFGFDKLVTIMSYKNCETLFANKYGEDVDFDGYITKFISSKPFEYSITANARDMLAKKLYSLLGLGHEEDNNVLLEITRKLERRSVRDIEKIYLFDPNTILKAKPYFDINGLKVSRECNILKIMAYEAMYDIDLLAYDHLFYNAKNQTSIARLFIPLYIFCKGEVRNFKIGKDFYSAEPTYDKNKNLVSLKISEASGISSPWYELSDFEDTISLYKYKSPIFDCFYSASNSDDELVDMRDDAIEDYAEFQ